MPPQEVFELLEFVDGLVKGYADPTASAVTYELQQHLQSFLALLRYKARLA